MRIMLVLSLLGSSAAVDPVPVTDGTDPRPITHVVKMLEELLTEMRTEESTDLTAFKKLDCWCITQDKEKKLAVDADKSVESELQRTVKKLTGIAAKITVVKNKANAEKTEQENALSLAGEIRQQAYEEYRKEEKIIEDTIRVLKSAVAALAPSQRDYVDETASGTTGFTTPRPPNAGSYPSQSGEVFGRLTTILKGFENELASLNARENQQSWDFASYKQNTLSMIKILNDRVVEKETELSATTANSDEKQGVLTSTQERIESNMDFLAELDKRCALARSQRALQVDKMAEEEKAITEAIKFLDSDQAHAIFSKTYRDDNLGFTPPALLFLQEGTVSEKNLPVEFVKKLVRGSNALGGSKVLAALAMKVDGELPRSMSFLIDNLITQLQHENDADLSFKAWCIDELARLATAASMVASSLGKVPTSAEAQLAALKVEYEGYAAELFDELMGLKKTSEVRQGQNAKFFESFTFQSKTRKVIEKVVFILEALGNRAPTDGQDVADTESNVGEWDSREYNMLRPEGWDVASSRSVVSVLNYIIAETRDLEDQLVAMEDAQLAAYNSYSAAAKTFIATALSAHDKKRLEYLDKLAIDQFNQNLRSELMSQQMGIQADEAATQKTCEFYTVEFQGALGGKIENDVTLPKGVQGRVQRRLAEIVVLRQVKGMIDYRNPQ